MHSVLKFAIFLIFVSPSARGQLLRYRYYGEELRGMQSPLTAAVVGNYNLSAYYLFDGNTVAHLRVLVFAYRQLASNKSPQQAIAIIKLKVKAVDGDHSSKYFYVLLEDCKWTRDSTGKHTFSFELRPPNNPNDVSILKDSEDDAKRDAEAMAQRGSQWDTDEADRVKRGKEKRTNAGKVFHILKIAIKLPLTLIKEFLKSPLTAYRFVKKHSETYAYAEAIRHWNGDPWTAEASMQNDVVKDKHYVCTVVGKKTDGSDKEVIANNQGSNSGGTHTSAITVENKNKSKAK